MRKNSSLFLMELILAILVFSMASTVCIQLFVKAHVVTQKSIALNQSVIHCQNMAEAICGLDVDADAFQKAMPNVQTVADGSFEEYFGKDWEPVSKEADANFKVVLSIEPIGANHLAKMMVTSYDLHDGAVIYSLPVTKYVGGGVAG